MIKISESRFFENLEVRLKITEIFHSIQGESTLAGLPFSFIRLTGCPLRCTYCDTTYSYTGGTWKTVGEILSAIESHSTPWVLVTGGEPLAQKNCIRLIESLHYIDKQISIETDGEEDLSGYTGLAKIIMDIKTPGSGETPRHCFENLKLLLSDDEIKFVITDKSDYEWAKNICEKYNLTRRFTVLFSPVFQKLELATIAQWILNDRLMVRLQTQLHKHIWGSERRGV